MSTQIDSSLRCAAASRLLAFVPRLEFGSASNYCNPVPLSPIRQAGMPALQSDLADFATRDSATLEILDCFLVLLRRRSRLEGAEISSLARLRILLLRI